MDARDLLIDEFNRIQELYADLASSAVDLHERPSGSGNSMAWLLWHAARVQDDHVAGVAGGGQAWDDFDSRFGLPFEHADIGYGHTSEEVSAVRVPDPALLIEYHAAVHQLTLSYLSRLTSEELDRVVDRRWDPPVTAGVRLVSVVGDCLQHLGQAAYVRGLLTSS
jgi:hypothetical protein